MSSVHIVSFKQTATLDIVDGITAHEISTNTSSFTPIQSIMKGGPNISITHILTYYSGCFSHEGDMLMCQAMLFPFFIYLFIWTPSPPILWICSQGHD